jgi:hypothetical protein
VVSDLEGFDPDDIAELQAIGEKVMLDAQTFYSMNILIPQEGAEQFIDAFNDGLDGDPESIVFLWEILYILGQSLSKAMEDDYEEED